MKAMRWTLRSILRPSSLRATSTRMETRTMKKAFYPRIVFRSPSSFSSRAGSLSPAGRPTSFLTPSSDPRSGPRFRREDREQPLLPAGEQGLLLGAGDVNGDGIDDFIVGWAWHFNETGEAYLIYGSRSGIGTAGFLKIYDFDWDSNLDGANGVRIRGAEDLSHAGHAVAGPGDVNGDGYADLLVGAPLSNPAGRTEAGETYLVFGSAGEIGTGGLLRASDLTTTGAGIRLRGRQPFDESGKTVSGVGDLNADGLPDFAVGAPGASSGAGEAYIVFGSRRGFGTGGILDLRLLNGTNGVWISMADSHRLGARVAGRETSTAMASPT